MADWTDEETHKLIELWGNDNIQAQLKKNKEVYNTSALLEVCVNLGTRRQLNNAWRRPRN